MKCHDCKQEIVTPESTVKNGFGSTGYAVIEEQHTICYNCCAIRDSERMQTDNRIALYLTKHDGQWTVSNWPGTLRLNAFVRIHKRGHNWGIPRRDAWFLDRHKQWWHGVNYGDWNDLCYCKKLKHDPGIPHWALREYSEIYA